jgi:hypothetical protein
MLHQIRHLNLPRKIQVKTNALGDPQAVHGRRGWIQVEGVRERWCLEDLWWREPILRSYFLVVLAGGQILCLFLDESQGSWYMQR